MKTDGTNLSMIRGDSETITIQCTDQEGLPISFVDIDDTVYFTVKLNTSTETKIFQKIITAFESGKAIIEIVPTDTHALQYKSYKYDVQWVDKNGRVRTIVTPSIFTVEPEVTFE